MEGLGKIGFDLKGIVFYMVNFGVVLWAVNKFAFVPLVAWADKRRHSISENLTAAEKIKTVLEQEMSDRAVEHTTQVKKMREEFATSDTQAKEQAKEIIASAERERQRILEEVKKESDVLKAQFKRDIEDELLAKITKVVTTSLRTGATPETASVIIANLWRENR